MQFHPPDHGALVNTAAAAGFGDHPPLPHVAQRSRRDKLRFPFVADAGAMLPSPYGYDDEAAFPPPPPPPPPPEPSYVGRVSASAADLGYLHAVVAPPPRPAAGEQWPTAQYDASGPWTWARPKVEHDEDEARTGIAAHQGAAALSLTLQSPAPQELPPAYGGSLQSVVGAAAAPAPAGPLGPFTGYAAVLNGSRFLRPAQQLLDEICAALLGAERSRWSAGAGGTCSLASPSSLSSSTDTGDRQYQRPEFREKKTKLLYMQEEVCRRYKQYHQQMQMVMSSFESVPGLSSATPYASCVLKAISKHFRRVRSVLSSQIQYISRLLGEELLSLPSCSRGSKAVARLGLTEQSQPVWRPQRGLPERAVSVLRAWLFDHFLHPYPTDADKHMLATQTGLSRNQVSNWFINARVRLWKPMVEEIHMLETRGSASTNAAGAAACSSDGVATPVAVGVGSHHHHHHQHQYQLLQEQQCLDHAPPPMGGQVMMSLGGAAPTADMGGGLGGAAAVSLTLGLRRDVSYQQYYQQQFGGHILGDLVG